MPRERSKARLAVNAGENMERELLWTFDNDVLSGGIPADHVVILWPFEEAKRAVRNEKARDGRVERTYA